MVTYYAKEYEPIDIPPDAYFKEGRLDIYRETMQFFDFELRGDDLVLSAKGYVGDIPLNERSRVSISPRVEIPSLERMFLIGEGIPISLTRFLRTYPPHELAASALADVFAAALAEVASDIQAFGLHREYVREEARTSFPRGRLLMRSTLALAARGVEHEVEAAWFSPTVDTALNQAIKDALWLCASRYARHKQLKATQLDLLSRLNTALRIFDGVSLNPSRTWLSNPMVLDPRRIPAHRAYYEPAVHLALAIVTGQGAELRGAEGLLRLPTLLLDLETVFENYARRVLVERQREFSCDVFAGSLDPPAGARRSLFDAGGKPSAEPDIVVRSKASGRPPVIAEVKYKPIDGLPSREDLNQAITYAAVYRSNTIVLVQPRGKRISAGIHRVGEIGDLTIYVYALDLGADTLERSEADYCRELFKLAA